MELTAEKEEKVVIIFIGSSLETQGLIDSDVKEVPHLLCIVLHENVTKFYFKINQSFKGIVSREPCQLRPVVLTVVKT
jgi:hypothetical protein